jgi:hypothetical protein
MYAEFDLICRHLRQTNKCIFQHTMTHIAIATESKRPWHGFLAGLFRTLTKVRHLHHFPAGAPTLISTSSFWRFIL